MAPKATIRGTNPARLRYDDLDGATITLVLQDATFAPEAGAADFELLGPPLGVSISGVEVQSPALASITLNYRGPVLSNRHTFAVRVGSTALAGGPHPSLDSGRINVRPNPDPWSTPILALYLLAVGVPTLLAAISQWTDVRALTDNDETTSAAERPNILLGLDWQLGNEELLLIFVASIGVFFACLAGLREAVTFVGTDQFDDRWWLWYLVRPIVGAGVAIATSWTLRAGLLGEGSELQHLNTFGLAAIAAVSGLFARNLIDKLRDLADVLFPVRCGGAYPGERPSSIDAPSARCQRSNSVSNSAPGRNRLLPSPSGRPVASHSPAVTAAIRAAPRAVVSTSAGRTTGRCRASA